MHDNELLRKWSETFYKKGWVSEIEMAQRDNSVKMKLNWTESGKEIILSLHKLLDELGFISGARRPGEIYVLQEMVTEKPSQELAQDQFMLPFFRTSVNTRMRRSGWINTQENEDQLIFVSWTEKGTEKRNRFRELLKTLNCEGTFAKEFDVLMIFIGACASAFYPEPKPPENRRF